MLGKISRNIIYRKKKGFGMPIARWINADMKPLVLEVLSRKSLEEMGLFNANYVERILSEHFANKNDNRKQIWTLIIFSLWWRRWFKDNNEV
jgi:asparagine synthase (glutamine-hydrolysing)